MPVVAVVIAAVLLASMLATSVYGAVTLPPDARVPVHLGIGSYDQRVSKTLGLIAWPAIGIVVAAVLTVTADKGHDHSSTMAVILPILLAVLLAVELGALRAARVDQSRG